MRILSLLLLVLLAGCAGGGDDFDYTTCGVRPRVELPVVMHGDVPFMQATIKGHPATFILDTGSDRVVLTDTAFKRLGLETDAHRVISSTGAGGSVRSFAGDLQDMKIGGLPVPDHEVQVLPPSSAIAAEGVADGLFGVSVLSVFEIDLDLPRREVTLYAGRLCPQTVVPPWKFPYSTIDAPHSVGGRFIIPVELNGQRISALLDTGAAKSVVARDVAQALGVTAAVLAHDPRVTLVGTGPRRPTAYLHRFKEIRFGDEIFPDPELLVADRPEKNIDMIIGSDYLAGHRLWLSYARKRVFIERGPTVP